MTKARYKRRNYLINKNFQGKLILGYFLFMVAGCLLFTVILAVLSADTMTMVYQDNDLQMGQTPLMLIKQVLTAHWVFIVVGGALIVTAATFITHRMAGPMFRLEQAVDHMIIGRLDDVIYLRKKDEGKELAAKLNQFNRELSQKIGKMEKRSKNIDDLLAQYSALDCKNTSPEDLESICTSLSRQNKAIQEITMTFQLLDE
ncbi:MAG: methyl-accepting chemotaxis protein [Proteobacteria bacterium]|nr:methyl-accepting chemotaxis protein [Pseudomonadota bacterium]MBU1419494.1 methyl-accepting chemotaxis protein [Pseudomonadota bacterium]MBU1456031.1 methyl-accepting chemotaxis protein [Pseudomonadota bacterium]